MHCTCHILTCNARAKPKGNPLRRDPSRTAGIQRRYQLAMRGKIKALKAALWRWLVMENRLHLPLDEHVTNVVRNAGYEFSSSADKIKGFRTWLDGQFKAGILSGDSAGSSWTSNYIYSAYQQGLVRAYTQSHPPKAGEKADFYEGGKSAFLQDTFDGAVSKDTIELLYTRSYTDLEGITASMDTKMSRLLADGLANGDGPGVIAKAMVEEMDSMTDGRAMTIARTETAYAQAQGQLNGFAALGVLQVGLLAELLTAGDDDVCPECQEAADNGPYTLDDAQGMIPLHPNCRCAWAPVNSDDAPTPDDSEE